MGVALSERYRLIECFTVPEAAQVAQLHRPELTLIDIRGNLSKHYSRVFGFVESARGTRCIIITTPGQLRSEQIPREVISRAEFFELPPGDAGTTALVHFLEESPDSEPTLTSPQGLTGPNQRGSADALPTASSSAVIPPTVIASTVIPSTLIPSEVRSVSISETSASIAQPMIADHFRTRTPELRQMLRRLDVAARHNVTILLIGETGCGKTHLASLIHDMSPRSADPFLHVACGALPGELIESELFGHVKGAFTSAHADKDGKFLAAGNGTILLDEIDVLTPDQQVKLLRVIERGEFEPVGSNRTLHVKARIIAASNLQLQPLVDQGRFRPDLYYRLNTLSFTIPPLRKRLPDIEPLARYFVHLHAAQFGIEVVDITSEFIEALQCYPWPGNVRELENAVRSAVIYSNNGRMIPETLPVHILEGTCGPANDPSVAGFFAAKNGESLGNRIELTEKDMIEQALLNNNFSRTNTARHLGISRVTLYNKMRKYGIMPER
jgi:transcriptional regulator with PAS, ATPase and Fis domain